MKAWYLTLLYIQKDNITLYTLHGVCEGHPQNTNAEHWFSGVLRIWVLPRIARSRSGIDLPWCCPSISKWTKKGQPSSHHFFRWCMRNQEDTTDIASHVVGDASISNITKPPVYEKQSWYIIIRMKFHSALFNVNGTWHPTRASRLHTRAWTKTLPKTHPTAWAWSMTCMPRPDLWICLYNFLLIKKMTKREKTMAKQTH